MNVRYSTTPKGERLTDNYVNGLLSGIIKSVKTTAARLKEFGKRSSRMKENFHVRFLVEVKRATAFTYPINQYYKSINLVP